MSNFGLMSLGSRAMNAAQAQLQTTGNNITNASVAGYSRQSVVLTTAPTQYSGAGYVGRGVDVTAVTRVVNSFLTDQVAQTGSSAAMDNKRAELLGQLESVFRTGESGLGSSITQLFTAWSDVATNPADLSARQVVLQRADDLASYFRGASGQLDDLQSQVKQEAGSSARSVSGLAAQVAQLNRQIVVAAGGGHAPNELLDQREQLIDQISQVVQVTRLEQSSPELDNVPEGCRPINLFIGGGQALVVGGSAATLGAVDDPADAGRVQLQITLAGQTTALAPASLGGGSMAGLLSFQDGDLQALRTRLDMLASGVATSINQQQALGRNLDAQAGAPIFVAGAGAGATSGINAGNIELSSALEGKPRALAAASSPVSVQISARQQGDLAVTSAQASAAVTLTKPTSLVFTDGAGAYEWRDAGGTALASGSWSAGTPISYAGVDFTLAGQPQAGEGFTVSPARENGNALLLAQLGNGALADGAVINDGYAQLISDVGTRAQGAQMAASVSAGVNEQAKAQLNSQTGVNLDEEAAKLIQYQQSYQAAAKVLQVAQKIFDTLLATTAG